MPDTTLETSLRALFDHGRDAMFIANSDAQFTHVNKAFLQLYSFTEEDVIGQPIGMIKSNLHDQRLYDTIEESLNKDGIWSGELRNTSYAGEIIHVWTQIVKTDAGFVGIQVDLRERDRTTRQVEQAARLESISTLAGGIAHEFNNILAGIQGHLYMVRRSIPEESVKEKERVNRIGKLIERASGLVQNMLVFSKQKQTVNQELSLSALLEDVVKLASPSIPKLIKVQTDIIPKRVRISANEIQLKQTLYELIANANAAFDRVQELTLPTNPQISIKLEINKDNQAVITIRDNGFGMDANELGHCLDPFYTTKPVGHGTGLGLTSANSYIKQLGGSLEIDSRPRVGTTVRITLPMIDDMEQVPSLNRSILLVDDDESIRISLHEILAHHGYRILEASDGVQALDIWQENSENIDAIIMDIVMPHMDGLEVAKSIRATGSKLPICMMTGYSNQHVQPELKVHLFRKPVDPGILLQYLENQLAANSLEK